MNFRSWTLRRWALAIGFVAVLLFVGLYVFAKWRLHGELATLRKEGKALRYDELTKVLPNVPRDENLVTVLTNFVVIKSAELREKNGDHAVPLFDGSKMPDVRARWTDNTRSNVANHLRECAAQLASCRNAVKRTNAQYCLARWPQSREWLGNLSKAKGAVRLLLLESAFAIEMRDHERAFSALETALKINRSLLREPFLLNQLVFFANNSMTVEACSRYLSGGLATTDELERLRVLIHELVDDDSFSRIWASERVSFLETYFYGSNEVYLSQATQALTPLSKALERSKVIGYRLAGFADADVRLFLKCADRLEQLSSGSLQQMHRASTNWPDDLPDGIHRRFCCWSGEWVGHADMFFRKEVREKTALLAVELAFDVEIYRRHHDGNLPASLASLVPGYIDSIPVEPSSGKPFELIRTADGYAIGQGVPLFKILR